MSVIAIDFNLYSTALLINSSGDTVITGRPMPVKGREIDAMKEQKILIDQKFEEWRRNEAQVDDVCMIGVRV